MASVFATSISFFASLKPTSLNTKISGRFSDVKLVSMSRPKSSFQICCAAKPETVSKVMEVVRKQLALAESDKITPESPFTDLGADSLDTVEIVMCLEEEFGLTIEEDNSQDISTVQDAADLIEKLISEKSSAA